MVSTSGLVGMEIVQIMEMEIDIDKTAAFVNVFNSN